MRVRLTMADQFGYDGPEPGDEGYVLESRKDEDGDTWYFVRFDRFSHEARGYYICRWDMIEVIS